VLSSQDACCTIVNFQSSMDYMKTFLVCYIYEKYHVCVCVLWVFTMLSDLAALSSHPNDEKLARHTSDSNRRKLFRMHFRSNTIACSFNFVCVLSCQINGACK
jgi:hypothetical protein